MNNIKGAIFDMDGLMIDTEKLYLKFWILAAKDFGYDMTPEAAYALRSMARHYSIPKGAWYRGQKGSVHPAGLPTRKGNKNGSGYGYSPREDC